MTSSLVDAVLFLALVLTSTCVGAMYLKLRRLDAYHAEYKGVFDQTAEALGSARDAIRDFTTEGREVLEALSAKIDEARAALSDLTAGSQEIGRRQAEASRARTDR